MSGDKLIHWKIGTDGKRSANARRTNGKGLLPLERMIIPPLAAWLSGHPCIGARQLGADRSFHVCVLGRMESLGSSLTFLQCLDEYLAIADQSDPVFKSMLVVFNDSVETEIEFYKKFWAFAQNTHDLDSITHGWDDHTPVDPLDENFELSFRGRAVFPATFHPQHPRPARRFMYPGWAHNLSSQFAELRAKNQFETWQQKIRKADSSLDPSGLPNPLLANKGDASSAAQLGQKKTNTYPFTVRHPLDFDQTLHALNAGAHAEKAQPVIEYLNAQVKAHGGK